jgi:hypothetical protein
MRGEALKQPLARIGRRNAAGGACQQTQPEPLLQALDLVAQGGLRNTELRRRARETAFTRDRQKCE